jgi:hypothetical protein
MGIVRSHLEPHGRNIEISCPRQTLGIVSDLAGGAFKFHKFNKGPAAEEIVGLDPGVKMKSYFTSSIVAVPSGSIALELAAARCAASPRVGITLHGKHKRRLGRATSN